MGGMEQVINLYKDQLLPKVPHILKVRPSGGRAVWSGSGLWSGLVQGTRLGVTKGQ